MGYKISNSDFNKILTEISGTYDIIGPTLMPFETRHSDQQVYGYGKIKTLEDLVLDKKTFFSTKEFVIPIRESLFYFSEDGIKEADLEMRDTILILRPCDINGVERLESIYLKNGNEPDYYFERRRKKLKFWMIECTEGFDSCFCVAMDSNKSSNYSAALRFNNENIQVDLKDGIFKNEFKNYGKEEKVDIEYIKKNKTEVHLPDPEKINIDLFDDPVWKEYTQRCINCGRCNTSCITCSCFSMQDVSYDKNNKLGERRRVWAGCHVDDFSSMAGGHDFRKKNGERMRFKTMHKIYDFKKRFDKNMCVGCGRCDDVCPEYISFSKCINKLYEITEGIKL